MCSQNFDEYFNRSEYNGEYNEALEEAMAEERRERRKKYLLSLPFDPDRILSPYDQILFDEAEREEEKRQEEEQAILNAIDKQNILDSVNDENTCDDSDIPF